MFVIGDELLLMLVPPPPEEDPEVVLLLLAMVLLERLPKLRLPFSAKEEKEAKKGDCC